MRCETCARWDRRKWITDVGYCRLWGVLRTEDYHCDRYTEDMGEDDYVDLGPIEEDAL